MGLVVINPSELNKGGIYCTAGGSTVRCEVACVGYVIVCMANNVITYGKYASNSNVNVVTRREVEGM